MKEEGELAYYKWLIVAAASIYCIMWSGLGYYVFSVFVDPLQTEFAWPRSSIMVAFLLWSLTNGAASVFAGRAVDLFRVKRVMIAGTVVTTIGFLLLSVIQSLATFYLSYVVIGIGIAFMGQVPSSALVSEWFSGKRGLAVGIMAVGVGLGGLIMPLISTGLLIPMLGWRSAYIGLAIIVFVVTLPVALLVIRSPVAVASTIEKGDSADTYGEFDPSARSDKHKKNPYLTSPLLWFIAFGFMFSQFGLTGTLQNQVPHMTDVGFSPIAAASVLGMIGLISSFAKLFFGWLCDKIPVPFAFLITVCLQASGTIILLNLNADTGIPILWVYAFAIGAGGGSWLPIMSLYISRSFPMKYYGTVIGIVNFLFSIGVATGPLFAGYLFDLNGSYQIPFKIFLGCYLVAFILGLLSYSKLRSPAN